MRIAFMIVFALAASSVRAHGDTPHAPQAMNESEAARLATPFGRPGVKATRTVAVRMDDSMRFSPDVLRVRRGETIRFVVSNRGKILHELVIGTADELARHAELMRRHPQMEHDEPNMTHVKPGAAGALLWTFDKAGDFAFACLVAGHYEAGMRGRIIVQ